MLDLATFEYSQGSTPSQAMEVEPVELRLRPHVRKLAALDFVWQDMQQRGVTDPADIAEGLIEEARRSGGELFDFELAETLEPDDVRVIAKSDPQFLPAIGVRYDDGDYSRPIKPAMARENVKQTVRSRPPGAGGLPSAAPLVRSLRYVEKRREFPPAANLARLFREGKSLAALALECGCGIDKMKRYVAEAGEVLERPKKVLPLAEDVARLLRNGGTWVGTATSLGSHPHALRRHLKAAGIVVRLPRNRGLNW